MMPKILSICLPKICHIIETGKKDELSPTGKETIQVCALKDPKVFSTMEQLLQAEKLKPGLLDFFVKNNVHIDIVSELYGHDIEGREVSGFGSALCTEGYGHLKFVSIPSISTIMHEFAHCKENVERVKKGLPTIEVGKTGGWKQIRERSLQYYPREEGKLLEVSGVVTWSPKVIPLGHEARAEHFKERMELKRLKEWEELFER